MTFNHEKQKVYQRTLIFNANVCSWISGWKGDHAVCDHLPRAAESMLDNIAAASAAYSAMKVRNLDYALGSTLECAACIDIALIKCLLVPAIARDTKAELLQLFKMLVGLRRSWSFDGVRESGVCYGSESRFAFSEEPCSEAASSDDEVFNHERLDVYQLSLKLVSPFSAEEFRSRISVAEFRRIDALVTSMILNIAEGNGRFSVLDQRRFLATSHEAAVKIAARLDLFVVQGVLTFENVEPWKRMLHRLAEMTAAMIERMRT